MASADQLKALLKSHADGDDDRFYTVAMQVAAHEAKQGHGRVAQELRERVDAAKRRRGPDTAVPISKPRGELAELLTISQPQSRLGHMVLDDTLGDQLRRVVREQRHAARLLENGLSPRRKLLLYGPPGTGKTLTGAVLAGELGLGETAAKLRQVFDATTQTRGVYFFDEFDAIGSQRGLNNDVGEIWRVLNSFLQMIEQDASHSLIIAATNHPEILDYALFRRFDDVLYYGLPDRDGIASLLENRLRHLAERDVSWQRVAGAALGLSYAELARAADEVLKETLIHDRASASEDEIRATIAERQTIAQRFDPQAK